MKKYTTWFFLLYSLFNPFGRQLFAQGVLDQKLTLHTNNKDMRNVLEQLETMAKVRFAYSPEYFDTNRLDLHYDDQLLAAILNQLLQKHNVQFPVKGSSSSCTSKPPGKTSL